MRAILMDYLRLGDELWTRFNAGKEDQLWYYESAVEAYETAGYKGHLLDELRRLVMQLRDQINVGK